MRFSMTARDMPEERQMIPKLNLHAHTRYSDGGGTIEEMAIQAKLTGHVACVITDHDYMLGGDETRVNGFNSNQARERYAAQLAEAAEISERMEYPIIIGCEISLWHEEGLLFGKEAISTFFTYRELIKSNIRGNTFDGSLHLPDHALILCHPSLRGKACENYYKMFDGFEAMNSGYLWPKEDREFLKSQGIRKWYLNLDAHGKSAYVNRGSFYNKIDRPINNETELIEWIKS